MSTLPRTNAIEAPIINLADPMVQEILDLDLAISDQMLFVNVYRKPSNEEGRPGWYMLGDEAFFSAGEAYARHADQQPGQDLVYEGVLPLTVRQARQEGCFIGQ